MDKARTCARAPLFAIAPLRTYMCVRVFHTRAGGARCPVLIYLSASFSRRAELRALIPELEACGHLVTSRWLMTRHDGDKVHPTTARRFAAEDLDDVRSAQLLILFLGATSTNKGGKACELGFALASGVPCWVVGDPGAFTIFHLLAARHFQNWSECKQALAMETQ